MPAIAPVNPSRLSANPAGSILQLFLSTTPLLLVLIYFLYLASKRPSLPIYTEATQIDDDVVIQKIYDDTGKQIRLVEMLYVFITILIIWCTLGVYLKYFVPKRRALINEYEQGRHVLGDVHYEEPKTICGGRIKLLRFSDYAHITYAHPYPDGLDPEKDDKAKGRAARDVPENQRVWMVRKRVRTYSAYTRERVTIIHLPDKPLSGQAKSDVETDLASASTKPRNSIPDIMKIVYFWVAFTALSPIYILVQIGKIDDFFENKTHGWWIYGIGVGVVCPLLAIGGNWLRWKVYHKWTTNKGVVFLGSLAITGDKEQSLGSDEEGLCMVNVCGQGENDVLDDEGGGRTFSTTSYQAMT